MFNCSIRQVLNLVLATAALLSGQVAANDVTSMLKNADNFRMEEESSKVVSVVHVFKNGEKEKHISTTFILALKGSRWWCLNPEWKQGRRC
ncbi:hypothetical protein VINI7043_15640 [Vibrio nigripulchritudo ATCC 27043]|nr:hypothetical protein VINI7043_15640 [Vibrio nigripulchritudo ATCC 27043]